ncbi:hypothetical protein HPO96_26130 [Kribbella sandramycini]|uniref:Uncharacterized protein n=1 Tax=Kribbella sandramycini TaxID=60450 RepID=A0A7Y4L3P4_9ACTN|nr:hypothetical protein [Kribbella sandramycini]MBB6570586.1 hypothetical protein [Kribbella sandramycini]NOL43732.1 hypothetical protein [Kribbella sandramycini]
MEFERFTREYAVARTELESGRLTDVGEIKAQLQELAAQLETATDREVAAGLIARLAAPENSEQSPELKSALRVLDEADFTSGTPEQRLAALAAARRQIWAIADRAGADSGAIRGLTRGLERSEELLTDDPWNNPSPSGA